MPKRLKGAVLAPPTPPQPARPTPWYEAVKKVQQYVVRLSSPASIGTGWVLTYAFNGRAVAIATAYHVLEHAYLWSQPIRVAHDGSTNWFLQPSQRRILVDERHDVAILLFHDEGRLTAPARVPELVPRTLHLLVGNEIGWLGYPALPQTEGSVCFFAGMVSAWLDGHHAYLVDGVAINGVSGGPAFHLDEECEPILAGVVTNYYPNRMTGEATPGLALVRTVESLHKLLATVHSWEEAEKVQAAGSAAAESKAAEGKAAPQSAPDPPLPHPPIPAPAEPPNKSEGAPSKESDVLFVGRDDTKAEGEA